MADESLIRIAPRLCVTWRGAAGSCAPDGGIDKYQKLVLARPDVVVKLIKGKWSKINWHDEVLRAMELERCKSAAPAAIANPDHQWFCRRADQVVTYADRALSILGFNRNGEFHSTVHATLHIANTTPASSTAKAECKAHAVRQIFEVMNAASTRYRLFLGASSCVPFPAFTGESDKAAAMQVQAKAARHLVTSIGVVMPSLLHGAAADNGDDDDDGGGDGGGSSQLNKKKGKKKKAVQELRDAQAASRSAKKPNAQGGGDSSGGGGGGGGIGGGGGGGGGANAPDDLAGRGKMTGGSLCSRGPRAQAAGPRAPKRSTSGVSRKSSRNATKLCVPFQFM